MAALMASSANTEQWILTGGSASSSAMSVFLIVSAWRARGDGAAAAISLETGFLDDAVLADLDVQLHHIAAGRRADHAGADARIVLVERANIAWVLVVIQNLFAISHRSFLRNVAAIALSERPTALC